MSEERTYVIQKLAQDLGQEAGAAAELFYSRQRPELAHRIMVAIDKALSSDEKGQPLPSPWRDEQAAKLLTKLPQFPEDTFTPDSFGIDKATELQGWIRTHPDDADKVLACVELMPPEGIRVESALSDVGKQKRVFNAQWRSFSEGPSRPIVLKWVSDPSKRDANATEDVAAILERELIAHPLSNIHPNIIGTHLLKNKKNENFLVEKRIDVLSNKWRADGIDECANLLYGIAMALSYIHAHDLVHGDIKPDNIGIDENQYILLDFGICRREIRFIGDEPTGSLRTRAPELLAASSKNNKKSDIWAIGATVFNASSVGRFPLYTDSGPTPNEKTERIRIARELAQRADEDWPHLVQGELAHAVPDPLRAVLERVLAKDPKERPSATQLVQMCESELAAHIRLQENNSVFSRTQEAEMVIRYISRNPEALRLMPKSQKRILRDILKNNEFKPKPADNHFVENLSAILKQVDKP